ncbi:MAG: hypothetical protein ACREP2_11805 [Rhodanobacteraceae bacterium]
MLRRNNDLLVVLTPINTIFVRILNHVSAWRRFSVEPVMAAHVKCRHSGAIASCTGDGPGMTRVGLI